ncbi:MAG: diguanylate cyclase [Gaiellales bacterium]
MEHKKQLGASRLAAAAARAVTGLWTLARRAHKWLHSTLQTRAHRLIQRAGAFGIRWKILGIALMGGAMTVLLMVLSIISIWEVGKSRDREAGVVSTRDSIITTRVSFGDVRKQLFRLSAEPGLGTEDAQEAVGALGQAVATLDDSGLPKESRRSIVSLRSALVVYVGNARGMAEQLAPGHAGPLDLAKFDDHQDALESLFDYATRDADQVLVKARADAAAELVRVKVGIIAAAVLALTVLFAMSIRLTLVLVRQFATLADMTRHVSKGNFGVRSGISGNDELGRLARGLDEMAESIAASAVQRETAHRREVFRNGLADALEMVDNEFAAARVIQRAFTELVPEEPAELLLADSSRAHLRRAARNPLVAPPDCQVGTPFDCAAVRRASTVVFDSSHSLSACPILAERGGPPCSAVCAPVSFMGESLGVVHVIGRESEPLDEAVVKQLETMAAQVGNRIGTLRAFTQTHLQATTDGLTGVLNRRSFEDVVRKLTQEGSSFAVAMADLDHFKQLNDTHGHEVGDRALRLFARVLREAVRADDIVARFGGEEFVLALPRSTAEQAAKLLERVQVALAAALSHGSVPGFTASYGVAVWTDDAKNLDDVIRDADTALYQAKSSGRNRVVISGGQSAEPDGGDVVTALGDALLDAL